MEFIEKDINKPWNWNYGISNNPNITMEFIEKYIDKDWNWDLISSNPSILFKDFIKYYKKNLEWNYISSNKFTKEKQLFIEEYYRKWISCYKIQIWYKSIRYNYKYKIGKININKIFLN
jgi:hypothetical protein